MTSDAIGSTRSAYDGTAEQYAEFVGTEIRSGIEGAIDRQQLADVADLIRHGDPGPVLDLGCGPGRIAAFLAPYDIAAIGLDLSSRMLGLARAANRVEALVQAEVAALPVATGSVAGAIAWYSIIHTAPEGIAGLAAEFGRVLRPGGHLLVGFQAGDQERVDRTVGDGHPLTSYRHDPEQVAENLAIAGIEVSSVTVRPAEGDHETTPQAFITGEKSSTPYGI